MEVLEQREYQTKAPEVIVQKLRQTMRALIVMATGLGKTITCGLTIQEYFKNVTSFRILYLCDRNLALSQAEKEFLEKLDMKVKPARFYAGSEVSGSKDEKTIVFASFQKMSSAREWYKQFPHDHFDLIIVDEAHHAFAQTYYAIIRYFLIDPCPIIGMTATPYRADQKDIKHLFGPPVVEISLEEGIAMGWLADLEYQILSDDLDEEKLEKIIDKELGDKRGRRPGLRSLNSTLFVRKRDAEIAKQIKFYSPQGRKTLIFCQSIAQANHFCPFLGAAAMVFHSRKNKNENEKTLREFREGPVKYLLVVDKLNEAFDMPEVEVVVFLRSTDSKRIFFQQLGRGLRKTRTKRRVVILDFVANCERLIHLATLASNIKSFSEKRLLEENLETNIFFSGVAQEEQTEFDVFLGKTQPARKVIDNPVFTIEGNGFNFVFTHKIMEMMYLLKVIRGEFYPTWQEASVAAISLGIKSRRDYKENYAKDRLLPSEPEVRYEDFPGYPKFLGTKKTYYPTWQEASVAAKNLNIQNQDQYVNDRRYRLDPRLVGWPVRYYPNFPGWAIFFGKKSKPNRRNTYSKWQEAASAAISIGITSHPTYRKLYKNDPYLPSRPETKYKNFPGWKKFFSKK